MTRPRSRLSGDSMPADVLDVAEFPNESGGVLFRVTRYFSADGARWVRHGPFVMYHPNGRVASGGDYRDGLGHGRWRDYYENGQLAAEGCIYDGRQEGYWRFWTRDAVEQPPVEYEAGEPVRGPQRGRRQ